MRFNIIWFIFLLAMADKTDGCDIARCGANADCFDKNGLVTCICKPTFFGNPYLACRPECVINMDCPNNLACMNNKCNDPCVGACGVNAHCQVVNHVPICFCAQGLSGDPFVTCYPFRPGKYILFIF